MKKNTKNPPYSRCKYFCILIICALLANLNIDYASASLSYSQATQLKVNAKHQTLKGVFDQIEKTSEFILLYDNDAVDPNQKVDISLSENSTIDEILSSVLDTESVGYKISDRQVLIYKKDTPSKTSTAQNKSQNQFIVSGVVSDQSGEPLIGVGVLEVNNPNNGAITDLDGKYTIKITSPNSKLEFSYIGYEKQVIEVASRSQINISLKEKASELDEVIVVAYGVQKKSSVTGAIATVNSDALKTVTTPNVNAMLQGKVAGVQVLNTSGRPGEAAQIRIRGKGTLNSSVDPLWVIDGVVSGTGAQLNPNEIESISVLKDGAATALYGSRATNGVILVTTKSGRMGEHKIDVSAKLGVSYQHLGKFKLMNSRELYDYTSSMEGLDKFGILDTWFNESLLHTDTDWFDFATQTALSQNYTVSYTAGTEKTRSFLSADYYNEEGTVKGFDYTRFNIRSNNDYKVSNTLTLKTKIAGSYWHDDNKQHSLSSAMNYLPWDSPFNEDGSIKKGDEETEGWHGRDQSNYYYNNRLNWARGKQLGVSGTFGVVWNIKDYLTFESNNNIGYRYHLTESYTDPRGYKVSEGGALSTQNSYTTTRYTNQMFRFNKLIDNVHDISAFAGYEYSDYKYEWNTAISSFIAPGGEVHNTASTPKEITGNKSEWAMQSFFFNANYTYNKKYMGQFSYRVDGSSRFGKDNRYGGFYTIGAGWSIHEEDFMKDIEFVDQLKLRGSYGSVGNTPGSGDYGHMSTYTLDLNYMGQPAAFPNQLAFPGLTWEKCYETNIAVDARLFDRVNLSIDYYHKNTSDLLYSVRLPSITGYTSQYQNVGKVLNEGVEITLSGEIIKMKDIQWNVQANLGFNKATIKELYNGRQIVENLKIKREDESLDSWYLREWAGVDIHTGQPMWYIEDEEGNQTLTYDYDKATRKVLGSSNPKFSGGIMTDVSYKDFTLSAAFSFVSGNKIYHYSREFYDNDGAYLTYNSMKLKDGWSRWEKPGDIASHPKAIAGGNNASNKPSSRYLEDGSFFKMNNVSLIYNLPSNLIKKVGLKYASVSLTGENLFTITNFSGADAELAAGKDNGVSGTDLYPSVRRFSLGVNLTF